MQPGFKIEQFSNPYKGYENILIQYNYSHLNIVSTISATSGYAALLLSIHTVAIFKIKWK